MKGLVVCSADMPHVVIGKRPCSLRTCYEEKDCPLRDSCLELQKELLEL